jgi:hypothetical protein
MRYLSIYKAPETNAPPSAEHMAKMEKLIEESMRSGELLATEGCLPTSFGARVRIVDGQISVTDGPFAETKEVIGGFAILQANSKAQAIEQARQFLQVMGAGECEVRQLFEPPAGATTGGAVRTHASLTEQFAQG